MHLSVNTCITSDLFSVKANRLLKTQFLQTLSIPVLALDNALHYRPQIECYHRIIRALISDEFTNELDFSFHSDHVGTRPGYYATYVVIPSNDTLHDDFSGAIPNEGNPAF